MEISKEEFERLTGRKVSEWEEVEPPKGWHSSRMYRCKACGWMTGYGKSRYCMDCGTRMIRKEDAEENDLK